MMKSISLILCLNLLLISSSVFAQNEKIEEFVVTIYDRSLKVISPDKAKNTYSIVIENKSLAKVIGKVQNSSGKIYSIVSIEPNSFSKVSVENKKGERVFFIPLSPAFQEAELIPGQKVYEIPPRH